MTYSNTNKDKTQSDRWRKSKQVLFYCVLGYIIYSSLVNIYRQFITLKSAQSRLETLEQRIDEVGSEKRKYLRMVKEATDSGTMARNQRQYFGLGTEKDYWLVLPSPFANEKIVNEVNEVEAEPNLIKWWNLFTEGLL